MANHAARRAAQAEQVRLSGLLTLSRTNTKHLRWVYPAPAAPVPDFTPTLREDYYSVASLGGCRNAALVPSRTDDVYKKGTIETQKPAWSKNRGVSLMGSRPSTIARNI